MIQQITLMYYSSHCQWLPDLSDRSWKISLKIQWAWFWSDRHRLSTDETPLATMELLLDLHKSKQDQNFHLKDTVIAPKARGTLKSMGRKKVQHPSGGCRTHYIFTGHDATRCAEETWWTIFALYRVKSTQRTRFHGLRRVFHRCECGRSLCIR